MQNSFNRVYLTQRRYSYPNVLSRQLFGLHWGLQDVCLPKRCHLCEIFQVQWLVLRQIDTMQVDLLRTKFLPPSLVVQEDFIYRSWEDLSLPRRWRQEDCPRLCLCSSLHGGIPEDWHLSSLLTSIFVKHYWVKMAVIPVYLLSNIANKCKLIYLYGIFTPI